MGKSKTAKWFRSLLGSKKSPPAPDSSSAAAAASPSKSHWALSKSAGYKLKNSDTPATPYVDANKHAIAVAAATAAVAEAALAAAQAAAEVVRLTSSGGSERNNVPAYVSTDGRRVAAVIKIQSTFRAYLARRALRALKGLVKLQALVRGHIVRRQSADMLRRMQAMARIQARASAHRFHVPDSSKPNIKFSNYPPSGAVNPKNYYQRPENARNGGYTTKQPRMNSRSHIESNWLNQWIEHYSWNNRYATSHDTASHGSDKILEIDTWKPRQPTRQSDRASPAGNETGQECPNSRLSSKLQKPNPSISSEEVASVVSAKEVDHVAVWTAESSPRVHSASSRPARGMFTPTRSLYGDYLSHPSYMANTESSRAKVRSQSAPRQRMRLDELGVSSTFGRNAWELDAVSEKGYAPPSDYRSPTYVKKQAARTRTRTPGTPQAINSSYGYRF